MGYKSVKYITSNYNAASPIYHTGPIDVFIKIVVCDYIYLLVQNPSLLCFDYAVKTAIIIRTCRNKIIHKI
jgi:hypothetical protein